MNGRAIYLVLGIFYWSVSFAQNAPPAAFERILRTYVVSLDRDLVLFRYEKKDPARFNPRTQQDLINRAYPWSKRFFNESIAGSPDGGGPGLYTSGDPVSTATWGFEEPGLFVFTLKNGSNVIAGDSRNVTKEQIAELSQIFRDLQCSSSDKPIADDADFSDVITKFRTAPNIACRRLVIDLFSRLQVRAILYGFNSVPMPNCRAVGTAVNIIDPDAIQLDQINYYSSERRVEGNPSLTPFVRRLFQELKGSYAPQTQLANFDLLNSFRNDFHLFEGVQGHIDQATYINWKEAHIMRCGRTWPFESRSALVILNLNSLYQKDDEVADLLIRASIAYRLRVKSGNHAILPPEELAVGRVRQIEDLLYLQFKNHMSTSRHDWAVAHRHYSYASHRQIAEMVHDRSLNAHLGSQLEKMSQVSETYDADAVRKPFLFARLLGDLGTSPLMSQYLYNFQALSKGMLPILKGNIFETSPEGLPALIRENRDLYIEIMRECLRIYEDRSISNEEVFNGKCGVLT